MGFREWFRGSEWVDPSEAMNSMYAKAYTNAVEKTTNPWALIGKEVPEWYNGPNTVWQAAMAEATMETQLKAGMAYQDWARSTPNWKKIGPNSTQPLPQMGDVLTTDGIMAIVRHEMEKGVAKAVVKCQHCGMWAARYCACRKCGAPVD